MVVSAGLDQSNRANGPNTWLLRTKRCDVKKVLASTRSRGAVNIVSRSQFRNSQSLRLSFESIEDASC
jgi:hypothetical protein